MTSAYDDQDLTGETTPDAPPLDERPAPLYTRDPRDHDGDQFDLADRQALRRVAGLSTELEDVTEVEYRRLRLERVVLAGVWTGGSLQGAAKPLPQLAALAATGRRGVPGGGLAGGGEPP